MEAGAECPVCQDTLTEGEECKRVPCGHMFHEACLLPWLKEVKSSLDARPPSRTPLPAHVRLVCVRDVDIISSLSPLSVNGRYSTIPVRYVASSWKRTTKTTSTIVAIEATDDALHSLLLLLAMTHAHGWL